MIQYDPRDDVTLFYYKSDGTRVSHNPLDGDAYFALEVIMQAQKTASQNNNRLRSNYMNLLSSAQTNVSAGRAAAAPDKPLMTIVDDEGNETKTPFDPPLPDLIQLHIAPVVAPSTPPDKISAMYNMISAIFKKTFPGV